MDDKDNGTVVKYSGAWWINQIDDFEKEAKRRFKDDGDATLNRYMDERDDDPLSASNKNKYNMFWANTQILKSALYAVPPKPVVSRENADAKDDVARVASLILERILQQGMTKSRSDAHDAFKKSVEDRLLPGLGQVWNRYTSKIDVDAEGNEHVVKEDACTDYVNWRDFLWSPARCWDEVWWVGRRVWMRRNKFVKRFGKGADVLWKQIRESVENPRDKTLIERSFFKGKAEVFEIWCETTGKVYFVARGLDDAIERLDDPLELEDFWPCPPPLLATHTNESLFPRADYTMVKDQYEELDTLNSRIAALTKALRVVGAYDKDNTELQNMLTGPEMAMVAVENWAMLGENGGMAKAVEWFPVEQVANVLKELIPMRASVVAQIYELTSISDIMRGASNPRETAAAQQLKAQYSSVRLQLTQQDVAVFVQNSLRIRAEIICKHMSPSTIVEMSQIDKTDTPPQLIIQAVQLLKSYEQAEYRVDVSEESLSMADYTAEREMRIELITAVGQFLSQSAQMVQTTPGALPYMLRIVQWVVASFRGSKEIESVLDQAIEAANSAPPPGQEEQKPDHSVEVANIKAKSDIDVANIKVQGDKDIEQMKLNAEQGRKEMELGEETYRQEQERFSNEELERQRIETERMASEQAAAQEAEAMQPVQQAVEDVNSRIEGLEQAQEEIKGLLGELIKAVSRTRRRIPRRNEEGDIIAVDEEIIQE